MKTLLAIWTISALLAKDVAALSWDVWFYVNQQEIAREKCENKARPMMHCDGKCYLAKQLKKLEQKEQNHSSRKNPFRNMEKASFFIPGMRFPEALQFSEEVNQSCFTYKSFVSHKNAGEVFHPPVLV
ncbi:MAG: hypothetical protein K0R65_454 [Crocinitomicaceae bacterium]|nr:hypothetical protein [Crocinitomicaceae bacterium]